MRAYRRTRQRNGPRACQSIALEKIDQGVWSLYLGAVHLGWIDEHTMKVYG